LLSLRQIYKSIRVGRKGVESKRLTSLSLLTY